MQQKYDKKKLNEAKKIFEIYKNGFTIKEIAKKLGLKTSTTYGKLANYVAQNEELKAEYQIARDAKIKKNLSEYSNIVDAYKGGLTYEEIGNKIGVSRERVRQILNEHIILEINKKTFVGKEVEIDVFLKDLKKEHKKNREKALVEKAREKIDPRKEELWELSEKFTSIHQFAKAAGLKVLEVKRGLPEITKSIEKRYLDKKKRWSIFYVSCKICGTTSKKHRSLGYCVDCYSKSSEFKEMQKESFERNKDARKKQQNAYIKKYMKRGYVKKRLKEYQQRPEVKKRYQENYYKNIYGSKENHENAIIKGGSVCNNCGMTRKEHLDKNKKDFSLAKKDGDINNTSLENLYPLCVSCFAKKNIKKARKARKLNEKK
jgi:hypothetical protein